MWMVNALVFFVLLFAVGAEYLDIQKNKNGTRGLRINCDQNRFELDGEPFHYIAGEIHYFRIPYMLWNDRLYRLRAMGLNVAQVYVCLIHISNQKLFRLLGTGTKNKRRCKTKTYSRFPEIRCRPALYLFLSILMSSEDSVEILTALSVYPTGQSVASIMYLGESTVNRRRLFRYNFQGDRDLAEFLRIAAKNNLYVNLRIGPYICKLFEIG